MGLLACEIRRLARWTSTLWFTSVLVVLVLELLRAYAVTRQEWADDSYTAALCADAHVRTSLGKNAGVCDDAAAGLALMPWQTAVARTAALVHLCGLSSCASFIEDLTSTTRGTLLLATVVLAVPAALVVAARLTAPPPQLHDRLALPLTTHGGRKFHNA